MLKFLYSAVTFSEIPEEITLSVAISGCQIHCKGCHSRELWEDKGTPLTLEEVNKLIEKNKGISCLLLLGGERDIDYLTSLFKSFYGKIKTAWYSGLDRLPEKNKEILQVLNFYKEGHYDPDLGGLISSTTNQVLYQVKHLEDNNIELQDITHKINSKEQTYLI